MHSVLRISCASGRCCAHTGTRSPLYAPITLKRHPLSRFGLHSVVAGPRRAQPEQQSSPKPAEEEEELPPWVRREKERELQAKQGFTGLPWPLSLLLSVLISIAAVGSIFEYVDKNPLFGVLAPDSPLWAPTILFLAVTGFPTAAFLFIQGVNRFNEDAERQDKLDGYL